MKKYVSCFLFFFFLPFFFLLSSVSAFLSLFRSKNFTILIYPFLKIIIFSLSRIPRVDENSVNTFVNRVNKRCFFPKYEIMFAGQAKKETLKSLFFNMMIKSCQLISYHSS